MHVTYNAEKSVNFERFTRTLMCKISRKMRTNTSNSNRAYLKKPVDDYNKIYHHSICKKPIDPDCFVLPENL